MKTALLASALCLLTALPAVAAPHGTVVVAFDHPDKFTDVKDAYFPTDKGRQAILDDLRDYLQRHGGYYVPPGYTLKLTFTDIKLAGDFEPWLGPNWENVRIIRAIYPPFFKFDYTVTDAAGKVVKQGKEDITDLAFQDRLAFPTDDPLRYEKSILGDWVMNFGHRLGA